MSASFFDSQSLFCSSYFNRLKEVSELIFVVVGFLLQYSSKLLSPDNHTSVCLSSYCCVGVDAGENSQAFNRLFLPSVMDALLSLASQLMRRAEVSHSSQSNQFKTHFSRSYNYNSVCLSVCQCMSLFRKVMDSVGLLLRAHSQLTTQGQLPHCLLIDIVQWYFIDNKLCFTSVSDSVFFHFLRSVLLYICWS